GRGEDEENQIQTEDINIHPAFCSAQKTHDLKIFNVTENAEIGQADPTSHQIFEELVTKSPKPSDLGPRYMHEIYLKILEPMMKTIKDYMDVSIASPNI
uniref:Uncharacterized protein n=1 Tax=Romanomermis culicivorax TaxID=13658 RepID=A0A915KIV9_ROMCU